MTAQLHLEHLAILFFATLKVAGYKKPFLKVFAHKNFLFKTGFEQIGVKIWSLFYKTAKFQTFKFGASTISWWEFKLTHVVL